MVAGGFRESKFEKTLQCSEFYQGVATIDCLIQMHDHAALVHTPVNLKSKPSSKVIGGRNELNDRRVVLNGWCLKKLYILGGGRGHFRPSLVLSLLGKARIYASLSVWVRTSLQMAS